MTGLYQKTFSSTEVLLMTGLTYRQLDYTITSGILTPSVEEGKGSGHPRRFSLEDVTLLRVVSALRQQGANGHVLRQAVRAIKDTEVQNGFLVVPPFDDPFVVSQHEEAFVPDVLSFAVINLALAVPE